MFERLKRLKGLAIGAGAAVGTLAATLVCRAADGDVTSTAYTLNYNDGNGLIYTLVNLVKGFIFQNVAITAAIGLVALVGLVFWILRKMHGAKK